MTEPPLSLIETATLLSTFGERTRARIQLQATRAQRDSSPREVELLLLLRDILFELDQSRRLLERLHGDAPRTPRCLPMPSTARREDDVGALAVTHEV